MRTALLSVSISLSFLNNDFNNSVTLELCNEIKALFGVFSSHCSGSYREEVTPGPIPNPEAKLFIADNTADCICGNVGRRQA